MDIGRELHALRARLDRIEASARLSHASIDNTAVEVRDDTGSLRGLVGVQADGTTAVNIVNGPPPPQPSAPIVTSVLGGITVSWDGTFTDGAIAPLDWQRVEVHASTTDGFTPTLETLKQTIESPQGSTVVVATDVPVYVLLLARSTSGTASTPSSQAGPLGPAPVVASDVLDGIITTVKLADDAVTAAKVATAAIDEDAIAAAAVTAAKIGTNAVVAGKIAAGAVSMNTLTGPLADTATQRYADLFRDASAWTQLSASSGGTWTINTTATDTPSGGGKLIATGDVQVATTALIPQDADTLYRVMVRARATAQDPSGVATVYLGVVGVAEDGLTLVNRAGANSNTTQYYCCTAGGSLGTADGWKTYVGWIQGHSATGVTAPAGPALDPRAPEVTHADVRYLRPMLWLNFGKTTAAVMEVEAVTVEAIRTGVVGSTNLITGSVTAGAIATDAVTAGKVAADAITAREITAGAVNTAELAAGAVTANELAANAVTAGKIAAGQVQAVHLVANAVEADKIAAGAVSADKIAANAVTTAKLDALAVTSDKIAANSITASKILAGAVDATALAADAITGKTITGGTITGAVLQTATSGVRITLNEANANKILVYNATRAVAELSSAGLGLVGSGGGLMVLDPSAVYPTIRLTNSAGTNSAVLNISESTPGSANPGLNTGTFTGSGFTDMKWRHFMGADFAVMERLRESNGTLVGGRIDLRSDYASFGMADTTGATQAADVVVTPGMAKTRGRHVIQPYVGDGNSVLFLQPGPSHTGQVIRCWDPDNNIYRFAVDRLGNTDINGILTAGNIAAGRITITPSAANTPTSSNVTGLSLKGSNIRVVATPSTSVPGTQVTGVGVTNVTSTGFTVWLTRTNTTSTGIDWIAFGT